MTESSPLPDPAEYRVDPNQRPLEIDPEARRGPALFRVLTLWMERLIGVILLALIVSVSANVVGRSLLNHSLPWADELARMLFIWMIFIGAAAAFLRYEHIAVDILVRKLPPRGAHVLYMLQHLIIAGLMAVMIWGGGNVMVKASGRTAILDVPWNLINASVVICALVIGAVALWRAAQSLRLIRSPDPSSSDRGD
ncbi:TRAP transporter small permease [Halomonas ramblicola]|uniref:TRAP transporter small permease n=1 Tax=Halomonas ramblicola TaxID=747349 RepID=UPI0025B4618A|nr:TRAP transporter small permease [Halomonas ramblicola]MDN3523156.1 TRAP transporter small permease [Halomonas ramblicola]